MVDMMKGMLLQIPIDHQIYKEDNIQMHRDGVGGAMLEQIN